MKAFRGAAAFAVAIATVASFRAAALADWPQFRGPLASGVATNSKPPLTWDVESGQNLLWRQPIPGLAHASPIVWSNRVYVATVARPGDKPQLKIGLYGDGDSYAEKVPHQWRVICLDPATGKLLWDKLGFESVPRLERTSKVKQ